MSLLCSPRTSLGHAHQLDPLSLYSDRYDMPQDSRHQWSGGARGDSAFQCFALDSPHGAPKRPRAPFSKEDKHRILQVRRRGACLRCRMLKIQCSNDDLCAPCLSSALKGSERRVLSFCYCVRTKFADVNIFRNETVDDIQAVSHLQRLNEKFDDAPTQSPLDGSGITDAVMEWLSDESPSARSGGIVALLTSTICHTIMRESIDLEVANYFRAFLFATSVTHTGYLGRPHEVEFTLEDMYRISHHAGFELLSRLDRLLSPQSLHKASTETAHALLLLVLGTTLGIGYSAAAVSSHALPQGLLAPQFQHSPSLWITMKEHLCQTLAHYIIFVASTLGVRFDTSAEERLINKAVARWDKDEHYVWAENPSYYNEEGTDEAAAPPAKAEQGRSFPVPIRCPELDGLPKLKLEDEPKEDVAPPAGTLMVDGDVPPDPDPAEGQGLEACAKQRIVKKRTVWIVRPHDNSGSGEIVNVLSRLTVEHDRVGMLV